MSFDQHRWVCPNCGSNNMASVSQCWRCGACLPTYPHASTIQLTPPPTQHIPAVRSSDPLDATERAVSIAWWGAASVLLGILANVAAGYFIHHLLLSTAPGITLTIRGELVGAFMADAFWGFLLSAAFTFTAMRLRRIYVFTPSGTPSYEIARRRKVFAPAVLIPFALVWAICLFVGYSSGDRTLAEHRRGLPPLGHPAAMPGNYPYEAQPGAQYGTPGPYDPNPGWSGL